MPIYEYNCEKCGKFELRQSINEEPLKIHTTCGSKVEKLFSVPQLNFVGSGFYVNDYKGK